MVCHWEERRTFADAANTLALGHRHSPLSWFKLLYLYCSHECQVCGGYALCLDFLRAMFEIPNFCWEHLIGSCPWMLWRVKCRYCSNVQRSEAAWKIVKLLSALDFRFGALGCIWLQDTPGLDRLRYDGQSHFPADPWELPIVCQQVWQFSISPANQTSFCIELNVITQDCEEMKLMIALCVLPKFVIHYTPWRLVLCVFCTAS